MDPAAVEVAPYNAFDRLADYLGTVRLKMGGRPEIPTLMHITHAKAGSSWVSSLLECLFPNHCAPRGELAAAGGDLASHRFEPGRVYRAMFLARDAFMAHPELEDIKRFVVLRDLRDTLISTYFSIKVSHATSGKLSNMQTLLERRELLQGLSEEEGLLYLLEQITPRTALLQNSWMDKGEIVLRYEDMLLDPMRFFHGLLIDRLQLPITPEALGRAVRRTHFQTVYRRKLGVEDLHSHGRRGLPGDWRNHFTPELRRQFGLKYAELLVKTGHEPDECWVSAA